MTKTQTAFFWFLSDNGKSAIRNPKWLGLSVIALVLVVVVGSVRAQQSTKIPRIGLLYASASGNSARIESFRRGLSELGYKEGKNIVVEYKYAEGKLDRYPVLAAELVRLNVDVIVTGGPAGTRPAKQATSTIPIVMAQDNDPVGNGFIGSLARPGGNITGLSTLGSPIRRKTSGVFKGDGSKTGSGGCTRDFNRAGQSTIC
jgi:ABC-type uncharacterized transport system substrate-binding protein